jgi:integrase
VPDLDTPINERFMPKVSQELLPNQLNPIIRKFEQSDAQRLKIAVGGVAGLYLLLQKTSSGCSRRWIIRCKINGKAIDRSLYGLTYEPNGSACGLSEARAKAREYRASLLAGIDPLVEAENQKSAEREAKELAKVKAITFEQAAVDYVAMNAASWAVNNKYRERNVMSGLQSRAFPVFGSKPVGEVDADDVFEALTKDDWLFEVTEATSRKIRDYINGVCEWAVGQGLRAEGILPASLVKGSRLAALYAPILHLIPKGGNNPTIDYREAPTFFRELCELPPSSGRNALIFGMLTALRGGSFRELRWSAVDWEDESCQVKEENRKKKGAGFYVSYLSQYAVAFLKSMPRFEGDCVFSADGGQNAITQTSLRRVIDAMNKRRRERGLPEWRDWTMKDDQGRSRVVVPHALCRTTFATWSEDDEHAVDAMISKLAVELCLDHNAGKAKGDPLNGAYRRHPKIKRRREAATLWGRFLITGRYPDESDAPEWDAWQKIVGQNA